MGLQRIAAFHLRSCGGGTDRGVWVSPLTHPTPPTTTKDRRRLHQAVGQWAVYSHMSLYRDAENVRPCAGKEGGVSVSCVLHLTTLPLFLSFYPTSTSGCGQRGDVGIARADDDDDLFPLTVTNHDTTRHRAHKLTSSTTPSYHTVSSEVRSIRSS